MSTKKRYTRKQLKQPDEFIALSQRVWQYAHQNRRALLIGGSALAIVVGGTVFWQQLAERRAEEVTEKLTQAIEIYDQAVLSAEAPPTGAASEEQEPPRFKTVAEKLKRTTSDLSTIIETYGQGGLEGLPLLIRASSRYDQGAYKEAIADYQAFLKENSHDPLRRVAIEGIAYAYEALEDWTEAGKQFSRLEALASAGNASGGKTSDEDPASRYQALYHQARLLAKQGKKEAAASAYKKIIDETKEQSLKERAGRQLASLTATELVQAAP